jgi:ribosome-binding factor A
VVSDAIQHRLSDPRISPFASVTRVEVSGDLMFATVYVSVMGTPVEQRKSLTGLEHATGHIQSLLARKLRIRQCPHIRFLSDDSIKKGTETIRMLDEVMEESRPGASSAGSGAADTSASADAGAGE